jgi:TolA-binding protein
VTQTAAQRSAQVASLREELREKTRHVAELNQVVEELNNSVSVLTTIQTEELAPLQKAEKEAVELSSQMHDWKALEMRLRGDMERLETERAQLQTNDPAHSKVERDEIPLVITESTDTFYW